MNLSKIRGCVYFPLITQNLVKRQNERQRERDGESDGTSTHPPKNDRFGAMTA